MRLTRCSQVRLLTAPRVDQFYGTIAPCSYANQYKRHASPGYRFHPSSPFYLFLSVNLFFLPPNLFSFLSLLVSSSFLSVFLISLFTFDRTSFGFLHNVSYLSASSSYPFSYPAFINLSYSSLACNLYFLAVLHFFAYVHQSFHLFTTIFILLRNIFYSRPFVLLFSFPSLFPLFSLSPRIVVSLHRSLLSLRIIEPFSGVSRPSWNTNPVVHASDDRGLNTHHLNRGESVLTLTPSIPTLIRRGSGLNRRLEAVILSFMGWRARPRIPLAPSFHGFRTSHASSTLS
ncbi:hypothetical protein PM082_014701 [Marasmius tenuissimus]|nr:hypothetical protein PM082_014701 [Marasmius tenuissimus]